MIFYKCEISQVAVGEVDILCVVVQFQEEHGIDFFQKNIYIIL